MARYRYEGIDAGTLDDLYEVADGSFKKLTLDLQPGQEFDAPDDWAPYPNPHPTFKLVSPPDKSAPPAPQESA